MYPSIHLCESHGNVFILKNKKENPSKEKNAKDRLREYTRHINNANRSGAEVMSSHDHMIDVNKGALPLKLIPWAANSKTRKRINC